jgi:hypothetical protein
MTVKLTNLSYLSADTGSWLAQVSSGFNNPLTSTNSVQKRINLGTSVANNVAGGSDEVYAAVLNISASASTTITITNLTDVCGQTGMAFARLKAWRIQLLGTGDVGGTSASSVSVGNAASHPFAFNLSSGSTTVQIDNGSVWSYADQGATGFTVTASTNDQIKILNNDSVNAAAVQIVLVGGSS